MQKNEQQEQLPTLLDKLFTPKQLADKNIMSLVSQWQKRKSGELKFYRIGRKILYSEAQINDYLAQSEDTTEVLLNGQKRPANRFGQ